MPSKSQPAEGLDDLPGFRSPPSSPMDPHPDESLPDQSTTSSPPAPNPSSATAGQSGAPGPSSTGSIDDDEPPKRPDPANISQELRDELENFSGGLFELAGLAVNRLVRARTHSQTRLWLVTDEESETFGSAAGRIVGRRIPEELAEGDGADALIMGSVLLGYGTRNVAGVTDAEQSAAAVPAQAAAPPPPPASAPAAAPPASVAAAPGRPPVVGVEEAAPDPPFSPDL
jgi:hypothetical protein